MVQCRPQVILTVPCDVVHIVSEAVDVLELFADLDKPRVTYKLTQP